MDGLTAFDIVVLLLVVLAAIGGLARGFVGEVVSLAAWVAGVMAVRFLYTPAKGIAAGVAGSEEGGAILAFVVLFLGAFIAVRLIGGRLSDSTRASVVGPIDRVLGLGFGAAKGVLASALLFLLVTMALDTVGGDRPEWLARARTAPTLAMVSRGMVDFVGEHARVDPDSAEAAPVDPDDPHAGLTGGDRFDDGYDRQQRSQLDKLLKQQEQQTPGTPI